MHRKGFFKGNNNTPSFLTPNQKDKIRELYFQTKEKEFFDYCAQIENHTIDKYYLQYIQGWFHKKLENYEKAEEHLIRALDLYKEAVMKGIVKRECGNYQIVYSRLYHEIALKKGEWKGRTKEELLDFAIEHYTKGIKLRGLARPVYTFNNLGECFELRGKEEEAINYYKKAIEKDKEDYWAYEKLAVICEKKGDEENARNYLKIAESLKSEKASSISSISKRDETFDMDEFSEDVVEDKSEVKKVSTSWRNL